VPVSAARFVPSTGEPPTEGTEIPALPAPPPRPARSRLIPRPKPSTPLEPPQRPDYGLEEAAFVTAWIRVQLEDAGIHARRYS
jgi:hypothetical protein